MQTVGSHPRFCRTERCGERSSFLFGHVRSAGEYHPRFRIRARFCCLSTSFCFAFLSTFLCPFFLFLSFSLVLYPLSFLPLSVSSARTCASSGQPREVESCDKSFCVERQTTTCPAGLVDDVLMVILNFLALDTPERPGLQTPARHCATPISAHFTKEL